MRGRVLGFSGAIGSGKSTVSKLLAEHLKWPIVSFGDYVRTEALKKGLDIESRQVLQSVGESIIKEKGWPEFCKEVIKQANWYPGQSLIVDGIRHEKAVQTLRGIVYPSSFYLIYIKIYNIEQVARLKNKGENVSSLKLIESNSTEIEVKANLPSLADLTIDGSKVVDKIIAEILIWLKKGGHCAPCG